MLCIHTFLFKKTTRAWFIQPSTSGIDGDLFSKNRFKSETQSSVISSNLAGQRHMGEAFLVGNVFCVKGSNISEKKHPVGTDFLK